jgi:hypothetical protein
MSTYGDLRGGVLDLEPSEAGLEPSEEHPNVWGVVMDLGYPEGTATVVGLSDGTTSLYTSSGGGVIGGGAHPPVVEATMRWLLIAEDAVGALDSATEFPLPDANHVAFAVLTFGGAYRGAATEEALRDEEHSLAPLFHAGHDVVTELRRADEAAQG